MQFPMNERLEAAIIAIVAAGGTVRLPVPDSLCITALDLDEFDQEWRAKDPRVRVYEEAHSHYFPARVAMLRRKYGMSYSSAFTNALVFQPEPTTESK